jgi:hypothetical protein
MSSLEFAPISKEGAPNRPDRRRAGCGDVRSRFTFEDREVEGAAGRSPFGATTYASDDNTGASRRVDLASVSPRALQPSLWLGVLPSTTRAISALPILCKAVRKKSATTTSTFMVSSLLVSSFLWTGGMRLTFSRGANFYPFPPTLARRLAKVWPSAAWAVFLRLEKSRPYDGNSLSWLKDLRF